MSFNFGPLQRPARIICTNHSTDKTEQNPDYLFLYGNTANCSMSNYPDIQIFKSEWDVKYCGNHV